MKVSENFPLRGANTVKTPFIVSFSRICEKFHIQEKYNKKTLDKWYSIISVESRANCEELYKNQLVANSIYIATIFFMVPNLCFFLARDFVRSVSYFQTAGIALKPL